MAGVHTADQLDQILFRQGVGIFDQLQALARGEVDLLSGEIAHDGVYAVLAQGINGSQGAGGDHGQALEGIHREVSGRVGFDEGHLGQRVHQDADVAGFVGEVRHSRRDSGQAGVLLNVRDANAVALVGGVGAVLDVAHDVVAQLLHHLVGQFLVYIGQEASHQRC